MNLNPVNTSRPSSKPESRAKTSNKKNRVDGDKTEKKEKKPPKSQIHLILQDEEVRVVPLMIMPESYYELQTVIAKYLPRTRRIVIVRDAEKLILTNKNFHPSIIYYVSEIHTSNVPEFIPVQTVHWDFTTYHAKPPSWHDAEQVEESENKTEEDELSKDDDLFAVSSQK